MSIIQAIVLGIVQGLAEFLPISSSAHLVIVSWLFGWDEFADDDSMRNAFTVALHIGTLTGVIVYFRDDIRRLVRGAFLDPRGVDGRVGWYIAFSAVPTAVVGAVLVNTIESGSRHIWLIGVLLIVGALGLGWADGTLGKRTIDDLRMRDIVWLSLLQVVSLQPGLSRAGITITTGRILGMARDAATRFAFLMSMPVIFGAIVYKYFDIGGWDGVPSDMRPAFAIGVVVSGVTGYAAIAGLLRLLRSRSFFGFVVYQLVLGFFVLSLLALGVSGP